MQRWFCILLTFLLVFPFQAQCWSKEGHRVVARIAARHLSEHALLRVSQLLEVENTAEAVGNALADASTWADDVRNDTGTAAWHFIDLALQDNRTNMPERCPNDDCATARIRLFAAQLKANDPDSDARFSDANALRFLIHFVGDVHQPLHAASNADRGGNCEMLIAPVDSAKDLHALWDGPLVNRMGADDALALELDKEIAVSTDDQKTDFASGDQDDWAWESHRLAIVNVYRRLQIPKQSVEFPASCEEAPDEIRESEIAVDEEYLQAVQPVVREQLKKAGLRLAKLLNEILA
jgi:hypothetical protein